MNSYNEVGIYKITNIKNNMIYIGQSRQLSKRLKSHKNAVEKSYIDNEIRKNPNDFKYEIIEYCSEEELNEKEIYWIKFYDSYNSGYNKTPGGTYYFCPQKASLKLLNDEDIIFIRKCYSDPRYTSGAQIQREFFPNLDRHLIAKIYNGQLRTNIMPEVYNKNYYHEIRSSNQFGDNNPSSKICSKDVIKIRILYIDNIREKIFNFFPQYNKRLITSIISGQNWKHLPIYKKKQKRWTYPKEFTDDEINNFKSFIEKEREVL